MILLVALLVTALAAAALGGPWLLRRAAPALAHTPRLAVLMLSAGVALWLAALGAVGPLLTWVTAGPILLPERAAQVCQRCLASANPFATALLDTSVPAIGLLAVPVVVAVVVMIMAVRELRGRHRATKRAAFPLRAQSTATHLHGHPVQVVHDSRPFAFSLPHRLGGIVISDAAVAVLSPLELVSVLEHESAHVSQRHHLITGVVASIARYLRWIPLIAAVADAIPHYLEIAADNAARAHTGTPALARALMKFGEPVRFGSSTGLALGVLNVAGPNRIGHLVNPGSRQTGRWSVIGIGGAVVTLVVVNAGIHLPYLGAAITGCA